MARCTLDIDNPKFRASIKGRDADIDAGLIELCDKVARDHKLSTWVNHMMPGYPPFQNRIWKWDFAPDGDKSSTRKGWRVYGYVENPEGPEPYRVTAFLLYAKPGPKGDHVSYVADVLKKFLERTFEIQAQEEKFRRQILSDGTHLSLCYECYEKIGPYAEFAELEAFEDTHECPNAKPVQAPTPN